MKCKNSKKHRINEYLLPLSFDQPLLPITLPRDIKILGWCPAGPVLPHGEKVPL